MKRRKFLKQGLAIGAASVLPLKMVSAQTMPDGFVNVKEYGATGNGSTDDSAAVQKAMTAALYVWFPAGTYLVGNLKLRSNQTIAGEGPTTTLRQKPGARWCMSANPGTEGYADPAKNLHDILIQDVRFEGQAGKVPFDEHYHLLNLNAVTDVQVVRCQFIKSVADGIYLGSSNALNVERHNYNVSIRDCVFDGFIKTGRNCITIIDGTGITIHNCKFTRWGQPGMPAAIDIEPNPGTADSFSRVGDITISSCTIWDMNSHSLIALALRPNDWLQNPVQNIKITNTRLVGSPTLDQYGLLVTQNNQVQGANPTENTIPLGLVVTGCSFEGGYRPLHMIATKGASFESCTFINSRASITLGDGAGIYRNRNITFRDVLFKQMGSDTTVGLTSMRVCGVDHLTIDACRFQDCGPMDGVNGQGLVFGGAVDSSYIALRNNTVCAPGGRTKLGIVVNSSHKLYAASNEHFGTILQDGVKYNNFLPGM
jgi:hypothetical protein